jgi:hypothetical protein
LIDQEAFYGHRNRGKNNLFFGGKKQDADVKASILD